MKHTEPNSPAFIEFKAEVIEIIQYRDNIEEDEAETDVCDMRKTLLECWEGGKTPDQTADAIMNPNRRREPPTETHEYLDHPDGRLVSAEYDNVKGEYIPESIEPYWSIRSLKASSEDDALKALLDERFDESNPVCDKIVPQSTFDDMADSLSSAIYLLRDKYYPDDELATEEFDAVINECLKSLENYNKITK